MQLDLEGFPEMEKSSYGERTLANLFFLFYFHKVCGILWSPLRGLDGKPSSFEDIQLAGNRKDSTEWSKLSVACGKMVGLDLPVQKVVETKSSSKTSPDKHLLCHILKLQPDLKSDIDVKSADVSMK